MTLLESMRHTCTEIIIKKTADGMGGYTTTETQGVSFESPIAKHEWTAAEKADKRYGDNSVYTVFLPRNTTLDLNSVFDADNGKRYRIITPRKDAPAYGRLPFAIVHAEEIPK